MVVKKNAAQIIEATSFIQRNKKQKKVYFYWSLNVFNSQTHCTDLKTTNEVFQLCFSACTQTIFTFCRIKAHVHSLKRLFAFR